MSAATQLALPTRLPLDPAALADLAPRERGRLYNGLDLDPPQRACVEEALRLIATDAYPDCAGAPGPAAAAHLAREREQRVALGRPTRSGS